MNTSLTEETATNCRFIFLIRKMSHRKRRDSQDSDTSGHISDGNYSDDTLMIPVFCHLPSQRRHFIFALFYVRQWTQVSCCCRGKNRSTGRFYRLQTDSNSTANCNVSLIYTGMGHPSLSGPVL